MTARSRRRADAVAPSAGAAVAGTPRAIVAAIVLLAAAARLWRLGHGLPDAMEEAIPLHRAFQMWPGEGPLDLRPGDYNYPSLPYYLHLAVQALLYAAGRASGVWNNASDFALSFRLDPTPHVRAARALGAVAGALTVWALVRVGDRLRPGAGVLAGAMAVVAPSLLGASRAVFTDPLMALFAAWALERLLAWRERGGRSGWAFAVLAGLATGCKYPAAVLLVPGAVAAVQREGARGLLRAATWSLVALAVFVASTPYALVDLPGLRAGLAYESEHARLGHLGLVGGSALSFHARRLFANLGPLGVVALLAAAPVAWRLRTPGAVPMLAALVTFAATLAATTVPADRYVLPVLVAALPLAALALQALVRRTPWPAAAAALGATLVVATQVPEARALVGAEAHTTQRDAHLWLLAHTTREQLLMSEAYGPELLARASVAEWRAGELGRRASPAWRQRLDDAPWRRLVVPPLEVAGRLALPVPDGEALVPLPDLTRLNDAYYAPALWSAADWVITSSAVRGRLTADSARVRAPLALYRALDRHAELAAHFVPGPGVQGPELHVYRLDAAARAALGSPLAVDPLWWTAPVDTAYRARADAILAARARADDPLRPWQRLLVPLFDGRVRPLLRALADELAPLGRHEAVLGYLRTSLAVIPADPDGARRGAASAVRLGRTDEARALMERALPAVPAPEAEPAFALDYARLLADTGEPARARAVLERLARALPAGDRVRAAAERELAR